MREILFRGKRLDGIWEEGYYFAKPIVNYHCILSGENQYQVDPATVGQYTGLVDKHGRKIFEGDVIMDSLGWMFEVRWDNDNGRFLGYHSKPRGDTYICYVGRVDKHDKPSTEIIGNIHDNPELLEATSCTE